MTIATLLGIYVFGSVGRGQQDGLSDLDVLCVVQNGAGRLAEGHIANYIPPELRSLKLSISWYGGNRLREMFRNGELFAWHLHQETFPLHDPVGFLGKLGRPADYRDSVADTRSFQKVLRDIPSQIVSTEYNAVYEAGLIYVCLRNIAMAASWLLCERPDFSRHSPFQLTGVEPCPVSKEDFALAMACRMAGQRGSSPPAGVGRSLVLEMFERLDPWIEELCSTLQRKQLNGR